jgi:hypothetical protein
VIPVSATAANVLAGQVIRRYLRIESWLDDRLLADDIPVIDATEEGDASLRVPERMTFSVPVEDNDFSWIPSKYDSALGAYGQRVRVSLGIDVGNGQIEYINRGWFLINTTATDGDVLNVECLGLLSLVDEAMLPTEYQPKSGATLASVVRALVEPGLTVFSDMAPADRAVPTSITFSDNRLDAVQAVIDAWPAQIYVTSDGYLAITADATTPVSGDVVLTLTDRYGGTVMAAGSQVTREGAFNCVVAKGQYPDTDATRAGQEIIQTAYDTDPASPYRKGGPFSPYLVPYGYASPLLDSPARVLTAANSVLKRLKRSRSRTVDVECVPHPGVQLGDVVRLTSERLSLDGALGTIDAYSLPYKSSGGSMHLTVRVEA